MGYAASYRPLRQGGEGGYQGNKDGVLGVRIIVAGVPERSSGKKGKPVERGDRVGSCRRVPDELVSSGGREGRVTCPVVGWESRAIGAKLGHKIMALGEQQ